MSLYAAVLVIKYQFTHVLKQHVRLSFTLLFNFASLPFRSQIQVVTYGNDTNTQIRGTRVNWKSVQVNLNEREQSCH